MSYIMEEGEIKKGLNIYLYYWTIVFSIGFLVIDTLAKDVKINFQNFNISLMISVVSFLFGFLITISFSMLLSRTAALRESLATETGRLISIYLLSKHLGEKFHKSVEDKIDEYTIRTLRDYTNYKVGREIIYQINDDLKLVELENNHQQSIYGSLLYILGELEPTREKLESLTKGKLLWSLKLSNYLLGIILIVLLFLNRGDRFSNILFILLSTIVVFILLIIEDYDNLKIGTYNMNINDSEQIFDLIGRERYYPEKVLKMAELEKGKVYRIGIYDSKEKSEKIVRLKYTPYFEVRLNKIIKGFSKKELE